MELMAAGGDMAGAAAEYSGGQVGDAVASLTGNEEADNDIRAFYAAKQKLLKRRFT